MQIDITHPIRFPLYISFRHFHPLTHFTYSACLTLLFQIIPNYFLRFIMPTTKKQADKSRDQQFRNLYAVQLSEWCQVARDIYHSPQGYSLVYTPQNLIYKTGTCLALSDSFLTSSDESARLAMTCYAASFFEERGLSIFRVLVHSVWEADEEEIRLEEAMISRRMARSDSDNKNNSQNQHEMMDIGMLEEPPVANAIRNRVARAMETACPEGWVLKAKPSGYRAMIVMVRPAGPISLSRAATPVSDPVDGVEVRTISSLEDEDFMPYLRLTHYGVTGDSHDDDDPWFPWFLYLNTRLVEYSKRFVAWRTSPTDPVLEWIGTASVCLPQQPSGGCKHGLVYEVKTRKAFRNRGIASSIFREMLSHSDVTGRELYLTTDVDNLAAQRLYERFGFERIGRTACWDFEFAKRSTNII